MLTENTQPDNHSDKTLDQLVNGDTSVDIVTESNSFLPPAQNVAEDKKDKVYRKIFKERESLLSTLFHQRPCSVIYHMLLGYIIYFIIVFLLRDLDEGEIDLGWKTLYWNFEKFPTAFLVWLGMFSSALMVFCLLTTWTRYGVGLKTSPCLLLIWNFMFSIIAFVFAASFLLVPATLVAKLDLHMSLSLSLLVEQLRFSMKISSFLRHTSSRKDLSEEPKFKNFFYFLFAPTLVYRDEYPRTASIRWWFVFQHALEFLLFAYYSTLLLDYYIVPTMKEISLGNMASSKVFRIMAANCLHLGTITLIGWYYFLHSWMNFWSEILRFGDRQFYQDWWNSTCYSEYYRKWNIIVHDWLHVHVYKEIITFLPRQVAVGITFCLSAFFHEYVIAVSLGFVFPALFLCLGPLGAIGTGISFIIPKKVSKSK